MISKLQLKQSIEMLPDSFTLDELIDKVILIDKIERGNEQSEKGETLSEQEVEFQIAKWFK